MTPITATKKPVRVEAVQFTGENGEEIRTWANHSPWVEYYPKTQYLCVAHSSGHKKVEEGNWVVKHEAGMNELPPIYCSGPKFARCYWVETKRTKCYVTLSRLQWSQDLKGERGVMYPMDISIRAHIRGKESLWCKSIGAFLRPYAGNEITEIRKVV